MGAWDWIKPIHSATAVADAADTKAREVKQTLSDDNAWDNFRNGAAKLSKNTALYTVRSFGGGPVIDIISRSMQDKKASSDKEKIKELETKVAKLEELITLPIEERRLITAPISQDNEFNLSSTMNHKPQDVLKILMMVHFVGTKHFDKLIIPASVGSKLKEMKPVSNDVDRKCE